MRKLVSIASALVLAAAVSAAAVAPSSAAPFHHHHGFPVGAGIAAGIVGFMAGAAIANSAQPRGYYYDDYGPGYGYRDHVAACYDAYRSYDRRTDTYLGFDGYRHRCDL